MRSAHQASGNVAPSSSDERGQSAEVGKIRDRPAVVVRHERASSEKVGLRLRFRIEKDAPTDIDVTSGDGGILVTLNPQGVARLSRLFPGEEPIGTVLSRLLEAVIEHAVHGREDEKYNKYVMPWLRDREEGK